MSKGQKSLIVLIEFGKAENLVERHTVSFCSPAGFKESLVALFSFFIVLSACPFNGLQ